MEGTKPSFSQKLKALCKRWFIDAFSGMAMGLFATLLIGLIIKQVGTLIGDNAIGNSLKTAGAIASALMGAGIGAGIARALKADKLTLFATIVAGFMGAHANAIIDGSFLSNGAIVSVAAGEPIGAYISSLIACEIGNLVQGKTKLDIILVPFSVIVSGLLVVYFICPFVIKLINVISDGILLATSLQPFLMGIVLSVVVGILLTLPTSSAAICISLKLGGLARCGGRRVRGTYGRFCGAVIPRKQVLGAYRTRYRDEHAPNTQRFQKTYHYASADSRIGYRRTYGDLPI